MVCVGLDPDEARLSKLVGEADQPYLAFCRAIVDATAPYVCAFKPQFAHFAAVGRTDELRSVCQYIKANYPQHILILDAKRGDIGSTAAFYAREAYEHYGADAVTVNPYLGEESLLPFLAFEQHGIVVLCRTSNPDSNWLQAVGEPTLYIRVAQKVTALNSKRQCMLVTGATYPEELAEIRQAVGDMPLLVPGIGAQGGDLAAVLRHGLDARGYGLLISSSRNIIYAGQEGDYAAAAGQAAEALRNEINEIKKAL